jgi:hypothetical protein
MSRIIPTILSALFLFLVVQLVPSTFEVYAEGEAHSEQPTPKRKRPILSFSKFEGALRSICDALALEGRSLRIFEVATVKRKEEKACVSCRALWVSLSSTCKPPKIEKIIKKKNKKKRPEGDGEEGTGEVAEEEQPTPTPAPTQIPKRRYPNPALLDAVSRVAVAMFEYDEGGESAKTAVNSFAETVLGMESLSVAEREYYEIFFEFFKAPWQGIPVTPTPKVEEDMSSFFE